MPALAVHTSVEVAPEDAFTFLLDFPGYAAYSPYLKSVTQDGPGGAGTEYELEVAWWKLSYTARTTVTEVDRPRRIGWRLLGDVTADGAWLLSPDPDNTMTDVTLYIRYETADLGSVGIDLPRLLPLSAVIERGKPVLEREAVRTVERVVADLEGEPREVALEIDTDPPPLDQ